MLRPCLYPMRYRGVRQSYWLALMFVARPLFLGDERSMERKAMLCRGRRVC